MDLQLLIKTSIDHESTHNHYLYIFMKCNIHKYVHTDILKYMEREQDKNIGMISVVQIHRCNTGKKQQH